MEKGGNMPCILNAANEVVVAAFLIDKIGFLEMSDVIEKVMDNTSFIKSPSIDDFYETDKEAREITRLLIAK